jgi:phage baseplate assembly protein V
MDVVSDYALNELDRRLANLVRVGKVKEIDTDEMRVKVQLGDDDNEHDTDWLPWATRRAGEDKTWDPPDVDEQVIVIAPGGELDQAFVWGALFSDDFPANGDDVKDRRVTFKDGSIIEFDRDASTLNMTLNEDAVFTLKIGSMEMKLTKDGAIIGSDNPSEFASRADRTDAELDKLKNAFNGHTHSGVIVSVSGGGGSPAVGTPGSSGGPSSSYTPDSTAADEVKIK